MKILIDGYNLLHAVGILGRGVGPGSLQRSRLALLNFLAESLQPDEVPHTTVVFDAHDPPPGLPPAVEHRGLTVRFAGEYEDADSLIEELIRCDSAPRRLTVVSSDHRLHRAARRRKARAIDSDAWYAEVCRRRRERGQQTPDAAARPYVPLLEEDVDYWIGQFGGESLLVKLIEEKSVVQRAMPEVPSNGEPPDEDVAGAKPSPEEFDNPFPPGYAEDLLEEDDQPADPHNPFPPGYGNDVEKE